MRTQVVACFVCAPISATLALSALQLPLSPTGIASGMAAFVIFMIAIGYFIDAWMS